MVSLKKIMLILSLTIILMLFLTIMANAQTIRQEAKNVGYHEILYAGTIINLFTGNSNMITIDAPLLVTGMGNTMQQTFTVKDNRVGIRTSNPQEALHVVGNARIQGNLNMSSNRIINLGTPTQDSDIATRQYVNENQIWTRGSGSSISYNSGNVGIGTTSLASSLYKLNVNGNVRASRYYAGTNMGITSSPRFINDAGEYCTFTISGGLITGISCSGGICDSACIDKCGTITLGSISCNCGAVTDRCKKCDINNNIVNEDDGTPVLSLCSIDDTDPLCGQGICVDGTPTSCNVLNSMAKQCEYGTYCCELWCRDSTIFTQPCTGNCLMNVCQCLDSNTPSLYCSAV